MFLRAKIRLFLLFVRKSQSVKPSQSSVKLLRHYVLFATIFVSKMRGVMNIDNKMSRRDCIVKLQSVGVSQSDIDLLVRSNPSWLMGLDK